MPAYITLDKIDYFIFELQNRGKSANTIISYSRNINQLISFLDGSELSREKMETYKNWLKKKNFKQRTINAYLAAANYFCEIMGWQEMKTSLEPVDYEDMQKSMSISLVNYKKLVYTALQNGNERLAMMVQVLCHTDLRFCELELLTTDILKKGFIEVIRKHKSVKILIPDMIIEDLNIYVQHKEINRGIIFRTRNGIMVNRSNFCKDLKKICILAGIEEYAGSIQHVKNVVIDKYPYYKLKDKI